MFSNCTALTSAPELPATTLAQSCYNNMFSNCTALTSAPNLPATTLVDKCYYYMFFGCTKLKEVTMLATDVNATDCLSAWLEDAGTYATSRTLKVENKDAYNTIVNTTYYDYVSATNISVLPDKWKAGTTTTGATILDANDTDITSTITSSTNP